MIQKMQIKKAIPTIKIRVAGTISEQNVVFFSVPAHKIGGKRIRPKPSPPRTASDDDFPIENWIMVAATGTMGNSRPRMTEIT